jgi:hypothetical protein
LSAKMTKDWTRNSTVFAHDGSKSLSLLTRNHQALHQLLPTRSRQEKLRKSNSWLDWLCSEIQRRTWLFRQVVRELDKDPRSKSG